MYPISYPQNYFLDIKHHRKSANKYGAKRVAGYDSQAEHDYRFVVLEARLKAGEIRDLQEHKTVELLPGVNWKVDFQYIETANDLKVWDEFKGFETADYILKKKIWKVLGPGPLRIVKGGGMRFRVVEEIHPAGFELVRR